MVRYDYLTTDQELADFCRVHAQARAIAFDTEFVSEDTYGPELCLIQVAVDEHLAIIDPVTISDRTPFWQMLATPGHDTIVHSGREEFRFCLTGSGHRPFGWFDVQIAAAFVGMEYPAAYNNLTAGYNAMQRWDDAIAAGREAVRLDPSSQLAHNNLAWALASKQIKR